jgi:hypothetical protein
MTVINSKKGDVKKLVVPTTSNQTTDSRGRFPTAFDTVSQVDFTSLQTRGYVVIPNLLSKETVDRLLADYYDDSATGPLELYQQGGIKCGINSHGLDDTINHLMTQIRKETNIKVDFCYPCITYFNNKDIQYTWHQDHDEYLLWQNSYDSLNIWIPLIKPEGDKDSLGVIPADRVNKYSHTLQGQGGRRFTDHNNGSTLMIDEFTGQEYTLNLSLDAIGESPILYPGDALVMRSDTIHKTQIQTHMRIAASIKCINTQGWIDRSTVDGWADTEWTGLIKNAINRSSNNKIDDSTLHAIFYRRLAQEFATKDRVKIQDIVLTKK